MSELRDYLAWHRQYDDPDSSLSWRLRAVQRYLRDGTALGAVTYGGVPSDLVPGRRLFTFSAEPTLPRARSTRCPLILRSRPCTSGPPVAG